MYWRAWVVMVGPVRFSKLNPKKRQYMVDSQATS